MKKLSKEERLIYKEEQKEKRLLKLQQALIVWSLKGSGLAFAGLWICLLVFNKLILGQESRVILSLIGSSGLGLILGIVLYRTIKMKLQAKIVAAEVVSELEAVGKNPLGGLFAKLLYISMPIIILSLVGYGVSSYVGSFSTVMLQLLVAGLGVIPYAIGEYIGWEMKKENVYKERLGNNDLIVESVVEQVKGYVTQ